jgi:RNA polymerase sigma factor (sigma-70 family)
MKTKAPKKLSKKLTPLLPAYEHWLIEQAQRGVDTALDELVVRYVKDIARLAHTYTPRGAKEKEEDAMLAKALKVFETTVCELPVTKAPVDLLVAFAHNMYKARLGSVNEDLVGQVKDAMRVHWLSCPISLDPLPTSEDERPLIDTMQQHVFPSALDILSRRDHADFVQKALELKQLKKNERTVLDLLYLKELSVHEVAERTGLSPNKIHSLESRARRVIRGELRDPRE